MIESQEGVWVQGKKETNNIDEIQSNTISSIKYIDNLKGTEKSITKELANNVISKVIHSPKIDELLEKYDNEVRKEIIKNIESFSYSYINNHGFLGETNIRAILEGNDFSDKVINDESRDKFIVYMLKFVFNNVDEVIETTERFIFDKDKIKDIQNNILEEQKVIDRKEELDEMILTSEEESLLENINKNGINSILAYDYLKDYGIGLIGEEGKRRLKGINKLKIEISKYIKNIEKLDNTFKGIIKNNHKMVFIDDIIKIIKNNIGIDNITDNDIIKYGSFNKVKDMKYERVNKKIINILQIILKGIHSSEVKEYIYDNLGFKGNALKNDLIKKLDSVNNLITYGKLKILENGKIELFSEEKEILKLISSIERKKGIDLINN